MDKSIFSIALTEEFDGGAFRPSRTSSTVPVQGYDDRLDEPWHFDPGNEFGQLPGGRHNDQGGLARGRIRPAPSPATEIALPKIGNFSGTGYGDG